MQSPTYTEEASRRFFATVVNDADAVVYHYSFSAHEGGDVDKIYVTHFAGDERFNFTITFDQFMKLDKRTIDGLVELTQIANKTHQVLHEQLKKYLSTHNAAVKGRLQEQL